MKKYPKKEISISTYGTGKNKFYSVERSNRSVGMGLKNFTNKRKAKSYALKISR